MRPRVGGTYVAAFQRMTRPCHVVIGYDFSHSGHEALRRGVALAARSASHVLHFVCVIDPKDPIPAIAAYNGVDAMYAARVQEALAMEVQQELDAADVTSRVEFFVHTRIGKPAPEILDLAKEVGAELIIVGSHHVTGVERWLVGSTSAKIVRDAGCSVEVARPRQYVETEPVPDAVDNEHTYVPAHRYTYEDRRVSLRPAEWPLG